MASLVGRALVPFFDEAGSVNESLALRRDDAPTPSDVTTIEYRPWNYAEGYFEAPVVVSSASSSHGAPAAPTAPVHKPSPAATRAPAPASTAAAVPKKKKNRQRGKDKITTSPVMTASGTPPLAPSVAGGAAGLLTPIQLSALVKKRPTSARHSDAPPHHPHHHHAHSQPPLGRHAEATATLNAVLGLNIAKTNDATTAAKTNDAAAAAISAAIGLTKPAAPPSGGKSKSRRKRGGKGTPKDTPKATPKAPKPTPKSRSKASKKGGKAPPPPASEFYAWSAFQASPDPTALPMPSFD